MTSRTGRFPHGAIVMLGLITIGAYGAWFYAFGVLLDPILDDTGWAESALAGAFSASALLGAASAVPAGRLIDRHGSRVGFLSAAVLSAAGLWVASLADDVVTFAAGAVVGGASLQALAFYHITQTTAVRVAPRQPARAIALLTIYGAFSSAIYLPLAAFLVTTTGWRVTIRILVSATALMLIAGAIGIRERRDTAAARSTPDFGLAFRQPAARRFVVASGLIGFGVGVVLVYQVPLMVGAGLSVGTAATMAGARGAAQITGRIPLGFILARLGPRLSVRLAFAMITLGMVILAFAGNVVVAGLYVLVAGFGVGATSPLQGIYANELFDEAHLGASLGVITMVFGMANAAGPAIVGVLADVSGTRWWGVALGVAAGSAAVLVMGEPGPVERRHRRDAAPLR